MKSNERVTFKYNNVLLKYTLYAYTFLIAFLSGIEVIRLTGILEIAYFNKVLSILVIFPAASIFLHNLVSTNYRINGFSLFLIFIGIVGAIVGASYGHSNYYIFSDVFSLISCAIIYSAYCSNSIKDEVIEKYISISSKLFLTFGAIGILSGYIAIYVFDKSFYLSLGSVYLLFPFCYYLIKRRMIGMVVTIFVILLGGKVGVILSALIVYIFYIFSQNRRQLALIAISSLFIGLFVLVLDTTNYKAPEAFGVLQRPIDKMNGYINQLKNEQDDAWLNSWGGRLAEVYYAGKKVSSYEGLPWVTGVGFGFVYDNYYRDETLADVHNVHISPVTIVLRHGAVFAFLFYMILMLILLRAYKNVIRKNRSSGYSVIFHFCIASLLFSFTAFNVFATILIWFYLGLLSSKQRRLNAERKMDNINANVAFIINDGRQRMPLV